MHGRLREEEDWVDQVRVATRWFFKSRIEEWGLLQVLFVGCVSHVLEAFTGSP